MPQIADSRNGKIVGGVASNQELARAKTSGTATAELGNEPVAIQYFASPGRGGGTYRYIRTFLYFDTTSIIAAPVNAKLKVAINTGLSQNSSDVIVVKSTAFGGDGSSEITGNEFNALDFGTTYSEEATNWAGVNSMALSSGALEDMSDNDFFIVALVDHDSDFQNADPFNGGSGSTSSGINFAGTIVLDYTAAAGYGNKVNGVAAASIGRVNGVATSSIGKVNGV